MNFIGKKCYIYFSKLISNLKQLWTITEIQIVLLLILEIIYALTWSLPSVTYWMKANFWMILGELFCSKIHVFVDRRSFTFHLSMLTAHFWFTILLACPLNLVVCLDNFGVLPTLTVTKLPITFYLSLHFISFSFILPFSSLPYLTMHPSSFPCINSLLGDFHFILEPF